MILDERFMDYFHDWQQPLLQFKPEGDPALRQNPHNDLMLELEDVFNGKAKPKVCYIVSPQTSWSKPYSASSDRIVGTL